MIEPPRGHARRRLKSVAGPSAGRAAASRVDDCDVEDCTDGQDNDGDGLVDADDPECTPTCDALETCNDGKDNDCDGLADARDADCIQVR